MTSPTRSHSLWRALLAVLAATTLLLAACGDDDDDTAAGGTLDSSGADASDDSDDGDDDDDTDADDTGEDSGDDGAADEEEPGGADCLVGTWEADPDAILAYYADLLPAEVRVVSASDSYRLVFTETTYEWLPAGTQVMEVAGTEAQAQVGGSITGQYAVEGNVITTELDEPNLTIQVTVQGTTIDGSDMGAGILDSSPIASSTFTCSSNELTIETDNAGVQGTLNLAR